MSASLLFLAERAKTAPTEAQYRAESIQSRLGILTKHIGETMMGVHADWESLRNAQPQGFRSATARALCLEIAYHTFPDEAFGICQFFHCSMHDIHEARRWVNQWIALSSENFYIHTHAKASAQHILGVAVEWSRPCDTETA